MTGSKKANNGPKLFPLGSASSPQLRMLVVDSQSGLLRFPVHIVPTAPVPFSSPVVIMWYMQKYSIVIISGDFLVIQITQGIILLITEEKDPKWMFFFFLSLLHIQNISSEPVFILF